MIKLYLLIATCCTLVAGFCLVYGIFASRPGATFWDYALGGFEWLLGAFFFFGLAASRWTRAQGQHNTPPSRS